MSRIARRRSSRPRRLGRVLAATGVISAGAVFAWDAPPPVHAAVGWSPEATVSGTGLSAAEMEIAVSDDATTAIATWSRSDGTNLRVEAATASIGRSGVTWSTPVLLSAAGQSAGAPSVAISANGATAVVAWNRSDGSRQRAQAVVGSISGGVATWGAVDTLSDSSQNVGYLDLALDGSGQIALLAWRRYDGAKWRAQSVVGTISGGVATWTSAATLSSAGSSTFTPDVAVARNGQAMGVTWEFEAASRIVQAVATTTSGLSTSFGSPGDLSAGGANATNQQIHVDNGIALATWSRYDAGDLITQVRTATLGAAPLIWSSVTDLSAAGQDAFWSATDLSGDASVAMAAWSRSNGTNAIVQARVATLTGATPSWGTTSDLSAPGFDASYVGVALAGDGTGAATVWKRPDASGFDRVQVSLGTSSGGGHVWSSPIDLSTNGQNADQPRIAMSADGSITLVAWLGHDGSSWTVRSRVRGDFLVASVPPPPPPPTTTTTTTTEAPVTTLPPATVPVTTPPTTDAGEVDPGSLLEEVAGDLGPANAGVVTRTPRLVDGEVQGALGGFVPGETVYVAFATAARDGVVVLQADSSGIVEVAIMETGSPSPSLELVLYAPRSQTGYRVAVERSIAVTDRLPATGVDPGGPVIALAAIMAGVILLGRRRRA